jgi:hypothetical protein
MKLLDLEWAPVLASLPKWERLSPEARRAFLAFKPTPGTAAPGPAQAAELVKEGLVDPPGPRGTFHRVRAEAKPLLSAVRAMDRVRVLDKTDTLPEPYLVEHFTFDHLRLLSGRPESGYSGYNWGFDRGPVRSMVSSVDWVREVLELKDADAAQKWESPRRMKIEVATLAAPATLHALQRLLRVLADHPRGVPLRMLAELLPDVSEEVRAAALGAGIRYLLLFPALRGAEPEACVGLLPAVVERMGPPPPPPDAVAATQRFEAAFRVADMTAVLVEAATEPIPVRGSDGRMYVRTQRRLAERLVHLPPWVAELAAPSSAEDDWDDDVGEVMPPGAVERLDLATVVLRTFKLAALRQVNNRWRLEPTKEGRRWLELPDGQRIKHFLEVFRGSPQRAPAVYYEDPGVADFFGVRVQFELEKRGDLRAPLEKAFLSVPAGTMVGLREFVRHQAQVGNPFVGPNAARIKYRWNRGPTTREGWEAVWSQVLMGFLLVRLVPYAGADMGVAPDGEACFGLTDAGRYLLGAVDDFELASAPEGEVVVQPDFEVVFLAPAPRVEAELGRFAERTGAGVGALFRITRASVLRAAEQGLTADAVVGVLERVSRSGVPANVARQVRDWIGGTRRVTVRTAVLIDCPDAETAGRVRGLGGARVSEVTPTMLRLDATGKERAAFVKKLRDKGIFVQG